MILSTDGRSAASSLKSGVQSFHLEEVNQAIPSGQVVSITDRCRLRLQKVPAFIIESEYALYLSNLQKPNPDEWSLFKLFPRLSASSTVDPNGVLPLDGSPPVSLVVGILGLRGERAVLGIPMAFQLQGNVKFSPNPDFSHIDRDPSISRNTINYTTWGSPTMAFLLTACACWVTFRTPAKRSRALLIWLSAVVLGQVLISSGVWLEAALTDPITGPIHVEPLVFERDLPKGWLRKMQQYTPDLWTYGWVMAAGALLAATHLFVFRRNRSVLCVSYGILFSVLCLHDYLLNVISKPNEGAADFLLSIISNAFGTWLHILVIAALIGRLSTEASWRVDNSIVSAAN